MSSNQNFIRVLDRATKGNRGLVFYARELGDEEIPGIKKGCPDQLYVAGLKNVPCGEEGTIYARSDQFVGADLPLVQRMYDVFRRNYEYDSLPMLLGRRNPPKGAFRWSWVWVDPSTLSPILVCGEEVAEHYNLLNG